MRTIPTILSLFLVLAAGAACSQTAVDEAPPPGEVTPAIETAQAAATDPAELLRNGKMPADGLLTGGQPTPEQLQTLAGLGYRTVINLRSPAENGSTDPAMVEALGMDYVSIPISGAADIGEENARRLAAELAAAEYPVVVHCASGNRVGALLALKAFLVDDQSPEDSLAFGRAAGVTRLEPVVKRELGLE